MKGLLAAGLALIPLCLGAVEEGVSPDAPTLVDGETVTDVSEPESPDFSGDVRIRLRDNRPLSSSFHDASPSLRHRPYFYQRSRARWADRLKAGFLTVRPVPGPSMAGGDLRRRGIVKGVVEIPDRLVAGDYSLSFGQGLMFYEDLGEFVRSPWTQGQGMRGSLSTTPDDHLRGAAVRVGKAWNATGFYSRSRLDVSLNEEGTGARDLWALRAGRFLSEEEDLSALNTVEERIGGIRLEGKRHGARLGATGASLRYGPSLAPEETPFGGPQPFRGDRLALWGLDASIVLGPWRLAADAAFSRDARGPGKAWAWTAFHQKSGTAYWASLFGYDGGYFSRHGKGPSFEVVDPPGSFPSNQRGLSLGARGKWTAATLEGEAVWAHFPSGMGNGRNEDPIFPSQGRRWRMEGTWRAAPEWELTGVLQERVRDRYEPKPGGGARTQGEEAVRRARAETVWSPSDRFRLKGRVDSRWERAPAAGRRAEGKLFMVEGRWTPARPWSFSARWYAFHSPSAYLTTGVEEIWDGVAAPRLAGGMGTLRGASGERYALAFRRRWGERFKTWVKYDGDRRWRGAAWAGGRHAWHFQSDFTW